MRERSKALGLKLATLFASLVVCTSCQAQQAAKLPCSIPFGLGVAIEYEPSLSAPLDKLGPVWYMDWRWEPPAIEGHDRLYVIRCWQVKPDRGAIERAMRASAPAWWSLGNEPNDPNQDNVSVEEYAELYREFESWASQSPGVHIASAGIANADWQWAEAFREAFRVKYGRYPRIDAWNIHNYVLEPEFDPYDVTEFQQRILAFRHWMESIGDGDKPLFLTEFGVLYGDGCCGRPVDPPDRLQAFMSQSINWMIESQAIDCWAWFSSRCELFNGDLMTADGQLTELGIAYRGLIRDWMRQSASERAPLPDQ
jgi:hypothetical protein